MFEKFGSMFNSFMMEVPTIFALQITGLESKSVDWFLYVRDPRHERIKHATGDQMLYPGAACYNVWLNIL